MKSLEMYRGKERGDIIKVNSAAYPNKKLAKIVSIYKTKSNNVRFVVKIAGGVRLDIHTKDVIFDTDPNPCSCEMATLMNSGCLCGGI